MTATTYGDELALVTVTYSPGATLAAMYESLAAATTRPVRVILADNGSVDNAPEALAATASNVELQATGANLGYGGGANAGVAALDERYGWIVICNTDVEFAPGAIDELLAAANRWPRGGSFGPLITEVTGEVYPSARLLPSIRGGVGHAVLGKVWPTNPWTRQYRQSDAAVIERSAGWLSGSCMLLRREAFDAVGGFDTRYFMYFEDVDLGDRLARAGWLNIYVPDARITHIGGHTTERVADKMLAAHHDSAYRYLADRHQGRRWMPLRMAIRAGLAVRLKLHTVRTGS